MSTNRNGRNDMLITGAGASIRTPMGIYSSISEAWLQTFPGFELATTAIELTILEPSTNQTAPLTLHVIGEVPANQTVVLCLRHNNTCTLLHSQYIKQVPSSLPSLVSANISLQSGNRTFAGVLRPLNHTGGFGFELDIQLVYIAAIAIVLFVLLWKFCATVLKRTQSYYS
jgi:hypothetical protein